MGFGLLAVVLAFALFLLAGCDNPELERMKEQTKQMELNSYQADQQRDFERYKFMERIRLCEKLVEEHHIPGDRSNINCGLGQ
jgi:outer membrane biogenesis lipoprotein LolB